MAEVAKSLPGKLTYEAVPEEKAKKMKEEMRAYERFEGFVRVMPGGFVLPDSYLDMAHSIYNFKFRPSDAVVMAFLKTGSTWLEEIVWTLRNNPNLDNPDVSIPIYERSQFIEYDLLKSTVKSHSAQIPGPSGPGEGWVKQNEVDSTIVKLENIQLEKRQLKTHLPFSFYAPALLDTCKTVCIVRNPMDVLQSRYNFAKNLTFTSFCGDFNDLVDSFLNDRPLYGPYWEHVREIWQKRDHPNVCVFVYEELLEDPEAGIRKLDQFLGTNLSDEQIKNVVVHTSFAQMKKRDGNSEKPLYKGLSKEGVFEKEGGFYRKGKVGSWKTLPLSNENHQKLVDWIERNEKDIGIKFRYE